MGSAIQDILPLTMNLLRINWIFEVTWFIGVLPSMDTHLCTAPVGPYQVKATATSLGGEHEDELRAGGVVELVHHLGPLLDGH